MKNFLRLCVLVVALLHLGPGQVNAQKAPEWLAIGPNDKLNELMAAGRYAEAIPVAKAQLADAESRLGKDHPDLIPYLQTLGAVCFARQDYDEAEPVYKRGLTIALRSFPRTDQRVASFAGVLFAIYTIDKRPAEAAEMMKIARPGQ
ncbi:tetratricopeptide repeat protein [Bradyrhizobium yuanmingense]|uniref:tetratricopeptide repeat protein n=1 Tax=Bradyrhizobium yuanmingense TaxID=108015 RepID=UPI0023B99950|nr:tetratricopeptide repeat protein [Bradyrhizobium yuanmingense]MDF0497337.1 tetratricopeptide repeat protein [Bradyrhizobium yuanmingense]